MIVYNWYTSVQNVSGEMKYHFVQDLLVLNVLQLLCGQLLTLYLTFDGGHGWTIGKHRDFMSHLTHRFTHKRDGLRLHLCVCRERKTATWRMYTLYNIKVHCKKKLEVKKNKSFYNLQWKTFLGKRYFMLYHVKMHYIEKCTERITLKRWQTDRCLLRSDTMALKQWWHL